jgi:Sec-independent protein secretion pathway component TatC
VKIIEKTAKMEDMQFKLSTLWIVVMFNMVFADILTFITPGVLKKIMTGYADGLQITQGVLLLFAVLIEIPIAMIFLSRVLKFKANRLANIIAAVITILFVVGGGSADLHYLFFATVEVVCMLLIIRYAWQWPNPEK